MLLSRATNRPTCTIGDLAITARAYPDHGRGRARRAYSNLFARRAFRKSKRQ